MKINKAKFREAIFEKMFNGNYNKCAKALGVEAPQLHRFLKLENSEAGAKLLGGLYAFCETNNLTFRDYIFLPQLSTAVYDIENKHIAALDKSA